MDAVASMPRVRLPGPRRILKLRSDAALVERFRDGDEAAFAVLYERHRTTVIAVCIGVLGSRHDAEDAAQETFTALAVALRGTPPLQLRGWLARVARNASIDLARRRRERVCAHEDINRQAAGETAGKAELETVLAGLRELPESQRTALLLRELAGHSYLEIATLLGTDEDRVRGLIARARVSLRNYREASELPCAAARAALCAEPDRRRVEKTARRHLRSCPSCRAYLEALRADARALRSITPVQGAGGLLGGGTAAGLAAKGALVGFGATQVTAACAVSVCALGGFVLLYDNGSGHVAQRRPARAAHTASARSPAGAPASESPPRAGARVTTASHHPSGSAGGSPTESSRPFAARSGSTSGARTGGSSAGRSSVRSTGGTTWTNPSQGGPSGSDGSSQGEPPPAAAQSGGGNYQEGSMPPNGNGPLRGQGSSGGGNAQWWDEQRTPGAGAGSQGGGGSPHPPRPDRGAGLGP